MNDTDGRNKSETAQQPEDVLGAAQLEHTRQPENQADASFGQTEAHASFSQAAPAGQAADIETTNGVANVGRILQEERTRRGLSIGEVARRLRLTEQQVEAIEAEAFAKLPSTTFLRGYVRNYANLLQLDNVKQLLAALPQFTPANSHSNEILAQRFKSIEPVFSRRNRSRPGLLYTAALLVAGLLAYGLYQNDKPEQAPSSLLDGFDATELIRSESGNSQAAIDLNLPMAPSSPAEHPVRPPVVAQQTPTVTAALPALPQSSTADASAAGAPDDEMKSLHFAFSRDSWVKVKDSDGKVILEKTHARGTERMITGKPPLYLVIGNAHGVALTYNGRTVDLAPYTRGNDDVARFSLE
ncbi:helix-turn-helix domain-containing protein [Nitrosomonas sp. ANs5]|uniref:helix-turn-helix domain-containing protein n=1 Tax=Nitrosomonas sp. ANs5 TaxID=3423941 RepID=UPI00396D998D